MPDTPTGADEGRQQPPPAPPPSSIGSTAPQVHYTPPPTLPYIITGIGLGFTALFIVCLWVRFFRRRAHRQLLAEHAAAQSVFDGIRDIERGPESRAEIILRPVILKEAVCVQQPDGSTEYAYSDTDDAATQGTEPTIEKGKVNSGWLRKMRTRAVSAADIANDRPLTTELASVTVTEGHGDDTWDTTEDGQSDHPMHRSHTGSCSTSEQATGRAAAGAGASGSSEEEEGCSSGDGHGTEVSRMQDCRRVQDVQDDTASSSSDSSSSSSLPSVATGVPGGGPRAGHVREHDRVHSVQSLVEMYEEEQEQQRAVIGHFSPGGFTSGPARPGELPVQHQQGFPERRVQQQEGGTDRAVAGQRRLGLTAEEVIELDRREAAELQREAADAAASRRGCFGRLTSVSGSTGSSRTANVLGARDASVPVMPLAWA